MDLRCTYARGLELENPLVGASAGTTEIVDKMKRCEDAGMSAVVMKSLFEDPVARRDPAPMFRLLQRRIGTVQKTQQITRAMRMVAGAKLRRAQEAIEAARPYAERMRATLAEVAASQKDAEHPLLAARDEVKAREIVVVTFTRAATAELRERLRSRLAMAVAVLAGRAEIGSDQLLTHLKLYAAQVRRGGRGGGR